MVIDGGGVVGSFVCVVVIVVVVSFVCEFIVVMLFRDRRVSLSNRVFLRDSIRRFLTAFSVEVCVEVCVSMVLNSLSSLC